MENEVKNLIRDAFMFCSLKEVFKAVPFHQKQWVKSEESVSPLFRHKDHMDVSDRILCVA
jgi:hypothetical protein